MRTENRKKQKRKNALKIIFLLLLATCLTTGGIIGYRYIRAEKSKRTVDALALAVQEQLAKSAEAAKKKAAEKKAEDPDAEVDENLFFLDFEELQKTNPDIIGWLIVDGTNISYPILHHQTDNKYYLTHNYLGEHDPCGSIFTETYNQTDFSDFNTVIYGHSMLNGTMFRQLHNFNNYDFLNSNGHITIYTPTKNIEYQAFEFATTDNTHIFAKLDNYSRDSIQNYINNMKAYQGGYIWKDGYSITPDSKIITLFTCTTSKKNRIIVHAVMTNCVEMEDEIDIIE